MPRQPFLPRFAHLRYSVGALALETRPEFCAVIGKCIALWGQVDNEMGNLLGLLLGTNSEAALEVFLSLRRASHQREALQAVAKYSLTGEDLETFQALIRGYSSLESQRNALAHGCFGICEDDSSVLFWIDVKDHVHFQVDVLSKEAQGVMDEDRHARLKEKMYVYRVGDLDALYEDMKEFWWAIFYFNGYLRNPADKWRRDELARLRAFPQIDAALKTIRIGSG